jgi:RHS repeat-associated protein
MKLTLRSICLVVLLFVSIGVASAQVQTGLPPFSAFGGGPDQINLANLNVHLRMPVVSKPGRGLPFTYNLSYDSSLWTPRNSSGTAVWTPSTNWGFTMGVPAWNGQVTANISSSCTYIPPPYNYYLCIYSDSNYAYRDSNGTLHSTTYSYYEVCSPSCSGGSSGSLVATDGSGYTISSSANSVTDRSGAVIYTGSTTLGTAGSIEDTNGNYVSATAAAPPGTSTTFTDTLNQSPLVIEPGGPTPPYAYYVTPTGNVYVQYTSYTVRTAFGCSGVSEYGPTTQYLPTEILFPDDTAYAFTYEQTPGYPSGYTTGRIASLILRTGGTINYTYPGANDGIVCSDGSTATLNRQTPDGTWQYARSENGTAWTTTITSPMYNGQTNKTVMNFQGIYPTETQVYQGSSTVLKTIYTCYNGAAPPCNSTSITLPITQETTYAQWPGGFESEVNATYNSYGLVTEDDEYGYGSGAPGSIVRKTFTSYASLGNGIANRPYQITIEDGANNVKSQTTYTYDQGTPTTSSGTAQHVSISGSRGNATTISNLVYGSTTLSKTVTYYDTGTVNIATDVNGAQTTFNYANATSTCQNAFPTSVTEPLNLTKSTVWNCSQGSATSETDENNATTSYGFSNSGYCVYYPAGCPATITDPLGNVTTLTYNGQTSSESSLVFNGGSSTTNSLMILDTLGRPHFSQVKESPSSSTYDSVETDYDALGRPDRTTLLYAGTSGQPCSGACPGTTVSYDALGRITSVADGGGGTVTYAYSQNDILVTAGPAPTGEKTKSKQFEYDALGRLTSVCEITSATGSGTCGQNTAQTGYWTNYTYDVDNNLVSVTQNAQSSNSQSRTYSYDGLGRMTSETNPESGTKTYYYDSDSTMCGLGPYTSNGDLVKTTDAAGICTTFKYDAQHRMTDVGSNESGSSCKRFRYDNTTGVLGSRPSGVSTANTMGRLAEAETDNCSWPITQASIVTDEWFSYDARGETSDLWQSTPDSNGYYHSNATYWANGALNELSGATNVPTYGMTWNLDGEGRVSSTTDGNGYHPLVSTSFNAASQPTILNFGSGDSDSYSYDPNTNRMTQYQFNVNGQSVTGNLSWNANGTLASLLITDPFNSSNTQACSYTHDDLVRIATANCGTASQTFSYDAFGNISKSGSPYSFAPTYSPSPSTNHVAQVGNCYPTYDANGDAMNDCLHTYSWDAYGRPTRIDGVGITYDALGREVEFGSSGAYTEIVYSPIGFRMQLMNGQSALQDFVPLSGGAMTIYTPSGLYWRHSDWLGSTRFTSTSSRTMFSDVAYAPFGDPYAVAGADDLLFTGMNQYTVSGVYDFPAREYNAIQSRWPSPDPAGIAAVSPADPQTWNRYAYVRNSPLSFIDPTGMDGLDYYNCEQNPGACADNWEDFSGAWGTSYSMDGVAVPSSIALSALSNFDAAAPCPNNNCSALAIGPDGQWYEEFEFPCAPGTVVPCVGTGLLPLPDQSTWQQPSWRQIIHLFASVPWQLNLAAFVPIGDFPVGPGPALTIAYDPSSHTVCAGGGFGAGTLGKAINFGPLMNGNISNADSILSGPSLSGGAQVSPFIGYQASGNSSGWLGGLSVGTPGLSITATYSGCKGF